MSANKLLQICSQAVDKLCSHCLFPKTHKLLHVCKQVVTNLFTSCRQVVFALFVPSCCNKFGTSWITTTCNKLDGINQTCYKVVLTNLIQSWYNKNVTRLMTKGCNNIVISWMYRTCWNKLILYLIARTIIIYFYNIAFVNSKCWLAKSRVDITQCQHGNVENFFLYVSLCYIIKQI